MEINSQTGGMTKYKNSFWNNWDFKTIVTIITVIVTVSFFFAKLEAKIESNYILTKAEIDHIRDNQAMNRELLESKISTLQTDVTVLRNYIRENSKLK